MKRELTIASPPSPSKKLKLASTILSEQDFGIKNYLNSTSKFTGIIKHRFNDFHVYEFNDKIVHLESLQPPLTSTEEPQEILSDSQKLDRLKEVLSDQPEFLKEFEEILNGGSAPIKTSPIEDKEARSAVHRVFKECYGTVCETSTVDNCIQVKKGKRKERAGKPNWKTLGGEYCHFTLYKENRDTMDALNVLSKMLKVDQKLFSFAGTKDKRAITAQRIAVQRVDATRIASVNRKLHGMRVGDFSYHPNKLTLADSKGNHFKIAIRNVEAESEDSVKDCLQSLKDVGFINYYGMQRFGTRSVSTHSIGLEILKGEYESACNLILGLNENERPDMKAGRDKWQETKDPAETLKLFPRQCLAERSILESLVHQKKEKTKNYLAAIQKIPKHLRLMYVHAYQSFVWNNATSERISKYGMNVVVGDLVQKQEETPIYVTDENIGDFDIYNVVLPLPGHSVLYPENEIFDYIKSLMGEEGLDPKSMSSKIYESNLPGSYRKIVCKPQNVDFQVVRYDEDEAELIQSDLAKIESKEPVQLSQDGKYMAVIVEFTLGASQYATMALREMTKQETSASFQTVLSQTQKSLVASDSVAEQL